MASSDSTATFANLLCQELEVVRSQGGGSYYTLESSEGHGLLVPVDREHGRYFMFWKSRPDAEEYLASRADKKRHRVSEISYREIEGLLQQGQMDGQSVVILDRKPDDSSRIASIDKVLALVQGLILKSEARLGQIDEFLGGIDELRKLAVLADDDYQYLPIDCPHCDNCFSVIEHEYRRWRLGHLPKMLCPNCSHLFAESNWGVMKCLSCGSWSRLVPSSIAHKNRDPLSPGSKWRCEKCLEPEVNLEFENRMRAVGNERESNATSKGCLTTVITLLVILCGSLLMI